MTKRASGAFARKASDFYPTPAAAVEPLIPHLFRTGVEAFAEPCSGEGDLIKHLEAKGFACVVESDLKDGWDAANPVAWSQDDYIAVDAVITNPPWKEPYLSDIMAHQSRFVPSWFLIYADWLFTKQSASLMWDRCTDIVPVGRLKWIEGSKSVGYDNFCWVRMSTDKACPVEFWPFPVKP